MVKTVLIVDDDPTQRRLMRAVCEKAGYPVLQADSGESALSLLQSQQGQDVGVMMLDLRMPGLGGMETLKRAKAFREELPIIVAAHDLFIAVIQDRHGRRVKFD